MVSGGPYGLEDIIGGAGYPIAVLLLLAVPLLWSVPTALMVGELAAAIPQDGGFYVWVREAMGPFWGFQEAWLSLAASIFDMAIYPTTFVLYLERLLPALTVGHRGLLLKLLIVALAVIWNLRGAASVGHGSVRLMLLSLSPFAVLIVVALGHASGHAHGPLAPATNPTHAGLSAAILVTLWNYMGWDNASTVAQEVEDPQRNYPRAMFSAVALVAAVYLLPTLAVWAGGLSAERLSTGAWVDAARLFGGPALALAVVLAGSIDGLGAFNALVLSYTRLPYAMALDGLLPRIFARRSARDVPWVSVLVLGAAWGLALGFTFERLITLDLVLYGASLLLEFAALVLLRLRAPELPRPFRIPGGTAVAAALGLAPALLIAYALWAARDERVAGISALLFATLIAAAGPVAYTLTRRLRRPGSPP